MPKVETFLTKEQIQYIQSKTDNRSKWIKDAVQERIDKEKRYEELPQCERCINEDICLFQQCNENEDCAGFEEFK